MLGWSSGDEILELEIGVDCMLDLDGVDDSADVDRSLATVKALAIEGGHDFGGIIRTILLAKPERKFQHSQVIPGSVGGDVPSRGFWEEEETENVDQRQNNLESNGKSPGHGGCVIADSVVQPVR